MLHIWQISNLSKRTSRKQKRIRLRGSVPKQLGSCIDSVRDLDHRRVHPTLVAQFILNFPHHGALVTSRIKHHAGIEIEIAYRTAATISRFQQPCRLCQAYRLLSIGRRRVGWQSAELIDELRLRLKIGKCHHLANFGVGIAGNASAAGQGN
jgi:hypothetical protein